MSVSFKAIQKVEPGVAGGGTKKWYAIAQYSGEMDLERLTRYLENVSSLSGADIRGVLYALVKVIPEALQDGQIVRLGELGSMRLSLSSEGQDTAEDLNSSHIKRGRILFSPGKSLKKVIRSLDYRRV